MTEFVGSEKVGETDSTWPGFVPIDVPDMPELLGDKAHSEQVELMHGQHVERSKAVGRMAGRSVFEDNRTIAVRMGTLQRVLGRERADPILRSLEESERAHRRVRRR